MAEHKLKIQKQYWDKVRNGLKTFEIRKNDRNYQVGDLIHFIPISDNSNMIIPHNQNTYIITYVFNGGEYGLSSDYCIFGIREIIQFNDDRPICTVRELISVLQNSALDNILVVDTGDDAEYEIYDVLRGNGTTKGISYLAIKEVCED